MTSAAVVSGATARIISLKDDDLVPKTSLPKETDQVLQHLEEIKDTKLVEVEKEVVRISYEIVDAIADAVSSKPSNIRFHGLLRVKKPGYPRQLEQLEKELAGLLQKEKEKEKDHAVAVTDRNPGKAESTVKAKINKGFFWPLNILTAMPSSEVLKMKFRIARGYLGPKRLEYNKPESSSAGSDRNPVSKENRFDVVRAELLNAESSSEVYLVGESGMGKTTLARKLFRDPQLRKIFKIFAWVPITRHFHTKEVLQLLLQQLGPSPNTREMNEVDLIARIFARLNGNPYLLVLEDIQSMDEWESIRLALPTAKSSRVIITTSSMDVMSETNKSRCHSISGLSQAEIIALLKEEAAFGSEIVGKAIYDISGGSPLFATILGKSLRSAVGDEQQLVDELQSYKDNRGTPRVLEASYKRLESEVKARLLYLGLFPAGQDVDIDKLYLLLAAENLIKEEPNISPQRLSEYLKGLDGLKLVQVQREDHTVPTRGLYKSCRLHDRVWDFCKFKALDEELFEIVKFGSSSLEEQVGAHTRRLAVHLGGDRVALPIKPATLKKLLTLLIIDTFETKSGWPPELKDLTDLSYLRILSFDGVNFKVRPFPKGMARLYLLRYLSFRGSFLEELPSYLSSLTLLETLDLLVRDECSLRIPANMFTNMKKMLHLYFPTKYWSSAAYGKTKLKLQAMKRLKLLVNFNTEICDVNDLNEFENLKILSTISKGKLDAVLFLFLTRKRLQYSSVDIVSFDCYSIASLSKLQQLLGCKSVHGVRIEGRIGKLPEKEEEDEDEAPTIEEIVLDGSQFQLDPLPYLGKYRNLRTLVLSNDAFLGGEIVIAESEVSLFPNLRSLKLQGLQFLKKMTIQNNNAMPMLSALQIHSCASLSELCLPEELHQRLQRAQGDSGGVAYSIMPFPSNFKTTPPAAASTTFSSTVAYVSSLLGRGSSPAEEQQIQGKGKTISED